MFKLIFQIFVSNTDPESIDSDKKKLKQSELALLSVTHAKLRGTAKHNLYQKVQYSGRGRKCAEPKLVLAV